VGGGHPSSLNFASGWPLAVSLRDKDINFSSITFCDIKYKLFIDIVKLTYTNLKTLSETLLIIFSYVLNTVGKFAQG
jgi:hypothetical protein